MRNFFRKVAAALRALRASVSEVVLRTVRGIDGTMTWIWDVVTRNAATAPVDYEPDLGPEPAPVQDEEHASLLDIGEQAVAAAQSLVRGQGAPAGTPSFAGGWRAWSGPTCSASPRPSRSTSAGMSPGRMS